MFSVEVSKNDIDSVVKEFKATAKQADSAAKYTIKETTNWAKSQYIKGVAGATGLRQEILKGNPAKNLKARVVTYSQRFMSRLYFGVRPMNLIRFNAKQNKFAVTSKIMSVKSAFIVEGMGRKGSYRTVFKRTGKGRLPIKPVNVDLYAYAKPVYEVLTPRVMDMFLAKFKQKLKWVTEK